MKSPSRPFWRVIMKTIIIISILLLLANPAFAADQTTGIDLLRECNSFFKAAAGKPDITLEDAIKAGQCTSFIDGVQQMHVAMVAAGKPLYCVPDNVLIAEMLRVVVEYMTSEKHFKEMQREQNKPAIILVSYAWREKWPCPIK